MSCDPAVFLARHRSGVRARNRLNPSLADQVLVTAHALLPIVLDVQADQFNIPEEPYRKLATQYQAIWQQGTEVCDRGTRPTSESSSENLRGLPIRQS